MNTTDKRPLSTLVGNSPQSKELGRLVARLGRSRASVLITGETGTGKEVVARALQAATPDRPFVVVDCSALPASLAESELFGHVRGAFTGANADREGLLAAADGGTAFLDEVGELPLELQAKLLRALQERSFRPVGSTRTRESNFRVVAATNRDLAAEVEKGNFRRDLYYRLNVVELRLSPLRTRPSDLRPLALHLLQRHGHEHLLTAEAVAAMERYDWPGNVRELENCLLHMLALSDSRELGPELLPSRILDTIGWQAPSGTVGIEQTPPPLVPEQPCAEPARSTQQIFEPTLEEGTVDIGIILPLEEVERRAILQALAYSRGDRARAASLLQIGRTTLYRKLKEYEETPGMDQQTQYYTQGCSPTALAVV